ATRSDLAITDPSFYASALNAEYLSPQRERRVGESQSGRATIQSRRAISSACSTQNTPALGPPPHSPSDSPGRFSHKNASQRSSPVSVVGVWPIFRPGGLHQLSSLV